MGHKLLRILQNEIECADKIPVVTPDTKKNLKLFLIVHFWNTNTATGAPSNDNLSVVEPTTSVAMNYTDLSTKVLLLLAQQNLSLIPNNYITIFS